MSTVARPKTTIMTSMIPGCCGLKTVRLLGCLGKTDAMSKESAEGFDALVKLGTADDGNWNTYGKAPDTIAILTSSNHYHQNDPENKELKRQQDFLEERGWTLLCTWKSHESGGTNYMYGSPGIKIGDGYEKQNKKK